MNKNKFRFYIIIYFLIYPLLQLNAQNDSIDNFFEIDSSKFIYYFDRGGIITLKSACDYYRVIKFPIETFPFSEEVNDFYKSGQLYFKGYVENGLFDGNAEYYYENGNIMITGEYKNGQRYGIWEFYYPNTKMERRILYRGDSLYILDFYKKNGKQLVTNGNGKYKGWAYLGPFRDLTYKMSGEVKDSLMNGKWNLGIDVEHFEDGKLIDGFGSCINEFYNPYVNEKVNVFISLNYTKTRSNSPIYNESKTINDFLADLRIGVYKTTIQNSFNTHWSLISFVIDKNNKIGNLNVISSEPTLKKYLTEFVNNSSWEAAQEIEKEKIKIATNDLAKFDIDEMRKQIEAISGEDIRTLKVTIKDNINSYIYIPVVYFENSVIIPEMFLKN